MTDQVEDGPGAPSTTAGGSDLAWGENEKKVNLMWEREGRGAADFGAATGRRRPAARVEARVVAAWCGSPQVAYGG